LGLFPHPPTTGPGRPRGSTLTAPHQQPVIIPAPLRLPHTTTAQRAPFFPTPPGMDHILLYPPSQGVSLAVFNPHRLTPPSSSGSDTDTDSDSDGDADDEREGGDSGIGGRRRRRPRSANRITPLQLPQPLVYGGWMFNGHPQPHPEAQGGHALGGHVPSEHHNPSHWATTTTTTTTTQPNGGGGFNPFLHRCTAIVPNHGYPHFRRAGTHPNPAAPPSPPPTMFELDLEFDSDFDLDLGGGFREGAVLMSDGEGQGEGEEGEEEELDSEGEDALLGMGG
ncbi:hypothetical protein C8A05DRAFT_32781, partial [Staphylotrichum tortipilum]